MASVSVLVSATHVSVSVTEVPASTTTLFNSQSGYKAGRSGRSKYVWDVQYEPSCLQFPSLVFERKKLPLHQTIRGLPMWNCVDAWYSSCLCLFHRKPLFTCMVFCLLNCLFRGLSHLHFITSNYLSILYNDFLLYWLILFESLLHHFPVSVSSRVIFTIFLS